MNVEARVRTLVEWLEVSVDRVLGSGSEGVSDHATEVLQGVGVVRQPDHSSIYSFPPRKRYFT